LFPCDFL
jgi:hypothetical protein